ncbi:response regulator [Colwellia demingiae]|uniref:Response regulator n=1 Tax=Colwellia demingiae TaxID=89401 RepID=A0A5C6Q3I7_9GAMM|nr:HD domain-containing phosphohydrolase [Colwellia demingiae]TWX63423.1 response regulator [Colwellia demingiae]
MITKHEKQSILVVDDVPVNIEVLRELLRSDYMVKAATNGVNAIKIAQSSPQPDLILLDIMMPDLDGYDVINRLKSNPKTAGIPVIFVTAMNEVHDEQLGFELGAVDYITKPISPSIVFARVKTHLAMYNYNRRLEEEVIKRTHELNHSQMEIIQRLGRAAEFKDDETGLHVIRMSHYSALIAQAAGMPPNWCETLKGAAPMHDIGKIGIAESILLKPGDLTDEEQKSLRKHPEIGAEIIGEHDSSLLKIARSIALTHHERWDGSGYPEGLSQSNIPIEGRIVAIADVFDVLTTARPYKESWSVEDAVMLIEESANSHFDPELVAAFLLALPEILIVKDKYQPTAS